MYCYQNIWKYTDYKQNLISKENPTKEVATIAEEVTVWPEHGIC